MITLCTIPVVLTLTFSWLFCNVTNSYDFSHIVSRTVDHFVGTIAHWTVWHWPSIMVSTVTFDDEVMHKICCFDLDRFFAHCTMNGGHFVDAITHWTIRHWPSIMVSTVSKDVVCTRPIALTMTFLWCFERSQTTLVLSTLYNGCSTKRVNSYDALFVVVWSMVLIDN